VSWWPLDTDGRDLIGNNDANLIGNPRFGPGKVDGAMLADGVDDEARVPGTASLDVGAGAGLSIEAWINPRDISHQHPIVEWNNHQVAGAHFWISVGPTIGNGPGSLYANLIDVNNNSHVIVSAPGLISTGVWQHVALTYDKASGNAALYLNGALAAQRNLGSFTAQTTPSYDVLIGRRIASPAFQEWFPGGLDEVGLYNRALGASEIQSVHNASFAGKCKPAQNNPPVAKAVIAPAIDLSPKLPGLLVIAPNGVNAVVTLNGSGSSDPDGDALTYTWYANGNTTPIATGVSNRVSLAVGSHEITLIVSDGEDTASDSVELQVVTIEDVIDVLVILVEDTELPRKSKRPLIDTLKQVNRALEGDRPGVAINKLEQFQQKTAAQIGPVNQECADLLINAAQQVIDALSAQGP
ncbi:MAG TPA: LamG-like jellyroll fold domain-containing protein, partial [Candidatus Binatia bacterium]|nr:LamG-like jellyroll fold domain-containing protein [Candidatus Binatia bacterium]